MAGVEKPPLWHDNHVETRGELIVTENLSNQSLSSVSFDRSAKLPGRGHSEPAGRCVIRQAEHGQIPAMNLATTSVNRLVLDPAAHPLTRTEP